MNPRTFLFPLILAALLPAGCASRVATYPGARKHHSQVALILQEGGQYDVRVVSVDGRRVASTRADLELLPGRRSIEVIYTPPRTTHSYPVRLSFTAQAGHLYSLSAKVLGGRDAGTGYWEGKYQAFIYDLENVHEVGRSPGPPPPGNPGNRG